MKSGLSFLVTSLRCEIDELLQLARTSELVTDIGRLVHHLQRERGIANMLLASGGLRFATEREQRIADSLPAEQAVRASFDLLEADAAHLANGARLFSRVAWVLPGLDALPELRRRVGALELTTASATNAYVKLVSGLLSVVFEAADGATDPEISRLLVALFNFMQGKEFAGQERACGAAAFASGRNEGARREQWLQLIDSQERCFQRFIDFAGDGIEARWQEAQSALPFADLERLRRIACAAPAEVALDVELSRTWFDACTQRIDAMHSIEEQLARDLRSLCEKKTEEAKLELQTHEALLARLVRSPVPPGASFFDADSAVPARPHEGLTLSPAAYGRQLERSILDLMQEQSQRLQAMSEELDTVRAALNERKLVERAKGLLMAHRRLSEADAHKMLRQTAMSQNRRLIEVAESVLSMADYLPKDRAS